jgi:hypothetical protein
MTKTKFTWDHVPHRAKASNWSERRETHRKVVAFRGPIAKWSFNIMTWTQFGELIGKVYKLPIPVDFILANNTWTSPSLIRRLVVRSQNFAPIQKLIDGGNHVSDSDVGVILQHLIYGGMLSPGHYLIRH